jgi:hypothetical protein
LSKPLISGDLVDAAAALLLCQHDSPLVGKHVPMDKSQDISYYGESDLMAAREAASRYLVAAFNAAITWNEDDTE